MSPKDKGNGGAPKSTKQAWDVESWNELEQVVTLEQVKAALRHKEEQRVYHKSAYLKRQAILLKAKALGLDKEV